MFDCLGVLEALTWDLLKSSFLVFERNLDR